MSVNGFLDDTSYKSEIDLSYLEKFSNRDNYQITTFFEKRNYECGDTFLARITRIYDLSKFWLVPKFHELDIFQQHLFRFYYMNRNDYKVPEEKIELNLYCVVFIDNSYYRGVIVGFPDTQDDQKEVQVYFIDYGMLGITSPLNIFYMSEPIIKVPQFVVRASLANTAPLKSREWTSEDVSKFTEMTVDKILECTVINVDSKTQVLEVDLSEENSTVSIPGLLIEEQNARHCQDQEEIVEDYSSYQTKLKYPYLFPTHDVLESGKIPSTIGDFEYQLENAPLNSAVLSRYFREKLLLDD